jgi:high-affinity nickel-transport protein
MNPLALFGIALVLGIRHATDPDHVVAVTAIAARTRRVTAAALLGVIWGLGHTLTLFVAGGAIIFFNLVVPPRVGLALEFAVAIALVAVGALNLRRARGAHDEHGGLAGEGRVPRRRAFGMGIVHGLAGSAAVALLVLATVRDPRLAAAYLALFGAGTLVGMALVTAGFAAPIATATRRWPSLGGNVRLATGVLSVAFGVWLMWQIGLVDGLFSATPHWDPH